MAGIEVNGARLELVEVGAGEPLVLVHGGAGDRRTWSAQLPVFGRGFRTIAYSRRYHWPNAPISDGGIYSIVEHVDDLEALLKARCGGTPVHLVGHSYGGLVSLMLALRVPKLLRSLVLAEPPVMTLFVSIPPRPHELLRLALRDPRLAAGIVKLGAFGLGPAEAALRKGDRDTAMRRLGTAILGPKAFAALSDERIAQVRDNLFKEEATSREAFVPLDATAIRTLRTPVLLVGGDQSPTVFARMLDHLEILLPNAERVLIRDASHIMHEDNESAYNQAVLSFLRGHSTPVEITGISGGVDPDLSGGRGR